MNLPAAAILFFGFLLGFHRFYRKVSWAEGLQTSLVSTLIYSLLLYLFSYLG